MTTQESKVYKALYFDLKIKDLKEHYSDKNPKQAYGLIQNYFDKNGFEHAQYSGYHSTYKTTDIEIFELISSMQAELPWIANCASHFEVTDIGENYDLMDLLKPYPTQLS